jgi:hypothetical protein
LTGGVGMATAQTTYPNVKVTGRVQEQFYQFSNDDYAFGTVGPKSNFFLRRARVEARGNISESVSFFIQPSFEGGSVSGVRLRDAYIDVRLTPADRPTAVYLRGGQEKRPFGRYELTSSNNLPSIERGGGRGLVRSVASNDLFTAAGFLSHDVGASLRLEHKLDDLRLVRVTIGAYDGDGESRLDGNSGKSFGARATVGVTPKLDVGGSFFAHDGTVGADSSFNNSAWGFDASWSKPGEAGLYLVGDYMQGEALAAAKPDMRGISLIGAYNIRMKSPTSWLYAIEPAFRFDHADPNVDTDDDGATLISAVLGFYLSSRVQFRVAYESQSFQAPGAESINGVRSALTVNF